MNQRPPPSAPATSNARRLRRDSTDAERLLWNHLRSRRLAGFKFRRQSPLGPYIADFECPAARLIIELDGGQHQAQANSDHERTKYLQGSGYQVLRFWNNEVLEDTDAILESILLTLESRRHENPPLPARKSPLPQGEG